MKPTQEQVIAWAKKDLIASYGVHLLETGWPIEFDLNELQQLCALAYEAGRKDENEACAMACDKLADEYADANAADCAFVIRERGAP